MDAVIAQLRKMQIEFKDIQQIYNKEGISLFRIMCKDIIYVLKYFENKAYSREIQNYSILKSLNVPTMNVVTSTECCLLMEDIEQSDFFRLGIEKDMDDIKVAMQIAKWYKHLHERGSIFIAANENDFYDENDLISLENIAFIKLRTATENNPIWIKIEKNIDIILSLIKKTERTLTYNDFYYSNLIVAKDKSSAYMFDYNLLGKGYAYADIRNVCYSLSEEAKRAFMNEYGGYNELEKIIDDVASVIVTLYFACKRDNFPKWAEPYLSEINNGFDDKLTILLNYA